MTKELVLKPCPFCGCAWVRSEETIWSFVVFCDNPDCGAEIDGEDMDMAAMRWNRRIPDNGTGDRNG